MGRLRIGLVMLGFLFAINGAAQATSCYGFDEGTKYQIAPTDPGGWTSHASIDAAVTAGIGAGRSTMEFQGTWSGIDETIDLRNNNLTFQGSGGTSMTWANTANLHAFGRQDGATFTTTIKDLTITTQGSGARGVTWAVTTWNGGWDGTLTVSNCTFDTVGDTIYMRSETTGGSGLNVDVDCTVEDSVLRSSGGSAIYTRVGNASGSVKVYDSHIEANVHGVVASYVWGGGNTVVVEGSEIVSNNPSPAAGDTGVYCAGFMPSRPLVVVDSLVAGFGMGIDGGNPAFTDNLYKSVLVANTTVIGTGSSTGIEVGLQPGNHNYDKISGILVNNIVAGHDVGLFANNSQSDLASSVAITGDNNALFDNTTDAATFGSPAGITDSGRLDEGGVLAGYTVANTFTDPGADNYRLVPGATALFDAGEQFTTGALGGTATYLDLNNNGSYDDGTDYVIDLGGGTPNAGTKLLLFDAEFAAAIARLQAGTVEIGAYEGAGGGAPVPEPSVLALSVLGLPLLRRRRS